MKPHLKISMLVLGVLVMALASARAEASSCSWRRSRGAGLHLHRNHIHSHWGVSPGPVGRFHQDAAVNLQGTQTRSVAGSSGVEDTSGTITMNTEDCSATGTINVLVGGQLQRTATLALAYDEDGNHMRAIFESLSLPDGANLPAVITSDSNRVNAKN
jgi:hypothetical protein